MGIFELLSLLAIVITWTWLAAWFVLGRSQRGSRATRNPKVLDSPENGEVLRRLQMLEADQVAFASTQEKLSTTVKRLSSRAGMRESRENARDSSSAPPPGTPKAELLRHYGMAGKVGPEFARAQQEIEFQRERTN